MAIKVGKTGTFNISTHNTAISGYVEWKETYDDSNYSKTNETTITMDVYLHRTNIYSGETMLYNVGGVRIAYFGNEEVRDDSNLTLSIPGNTSSSGGAYSKVYSASKTIKHNDDGSKSITLGYYMTNYWESGSASNAFKVDKTTSNVTLTTIPRASEVSSSSPYIGDNATIIISSKSSSFRHTLTYAFGNATGTIVEKTSATTVAWDTNAIKSSLYAQIPNDKSGYGTITCQTYNGDTLVGSKSTTFYLYTKESDCKPSISGSVVDTNSSTIALTGNSAVMVRYMSKPKVTISATANYSSSIKSYSINVDGQTSNSSSATYNTISSNSITISVTDSRGYSNSKTLIPSMISYIKLTSNLTITRPEQTSNEAYLNGGGQWFNGSFSSSNANTLTITAKYRKSGDSTWTDLGTLTPSKNGNYFSFSNLKLGSSFDYKNEYQFQITIADKLQTIGNQTKDIVILSTGKAIVRIGKEEVIVNGTVTGQDLKGKTNGYTWDINTENTSDVWMPVFNGNTIQHRVINANVNTHYNGGTSNLNNATATGWYRFSNDASNRPSSMAGWGTVVVQNDGSWVFQTAYGTYSQHGVRIAHRGYINGSWTEWEYLDNRRSLIYDAPLKGGESAVLNNAKRYLDVYFLMTHDMGTLTGKYIIDTAPANVTYGSVLLLCHDSGGNEYYVSESYYDKTTKTFMHKRTGYCNIANGTFTSRNDNSGYRVYRIETYD